MALGVSVPVLVYGLEQSAPWECYRLAVTGDAPWMCSLLWPLEIEIPALLVVLAAFTAFTVYHRRIKND